MTFGSLGSDGERHMRQGSVPTNPSAQPGSHFRRESGHSAQGENAGRGNFQPQGGRGRGYNPHGNNYNQQMGYPPNNQFRNGPGQGRGMPPAFQPQPRNIQYPNSPQPARSPALVPSMPNTPNMSSASMQPNMPMQTPPQYHYPPPMTAQHQQNFGYPPQQMDGYGRPLSMPYGYNNMPYMAPPQANSPGYNQNFVSPYHQQSHSMSRTPSQPERPPSANQQSQPVIVSSNQPQSSQLKPTASSFVKMPKKSAAIQIKNASGEIIDTSTFKAPSSPASSIQQSKTPPVATSTPTPPPKAATPAHVRAESQVVPKTAKQIQDELKEKIKQATQAATAKKEEPKTTEAPAEKPVEKPAEKSAEVKAEAEAAVPAKVETEVKEPEPAPKAEETVVKQEDKKEEVKEDKKEEPAKSEDPEEDEIERMIREMEEADAKREAQAEEYRKKQEAEKAAAKAKAKADGPKNAAEEDRKLREQEREMERLEEEKEKRRQQGESGSQVLSVAEALAAARAGKGSEAPKVDSVADKLASMKIGDKATPAETAGPKHEKRGAKPAALNLAPLNTKSVEPPQPSAALQSLKSARFLKVIEQDIYPAGIQSPNPSLNAAVAKKGKSFKYDAGFLLQFQKVFTEQPSLEFHQQVKSLIGDEPGRTPSNRGPPRTNSSRGNGSSGFPISSGTGGFPGGGFPGARPGASSMDRNPMGNVGGIGGRNPMASFPRPGGGFPNSPSGRGPHSGGPAGSNPRTNSRNVRGSRPRTNAASESRAAATMPLTANMDIKPIAVTAGGWKPTSVGAKPSASSAASGYLDPEMVQRKVKAALNKMTPEKFDKIADQILLIASQSKDESDGRTLRQVIQLTFEKATDEAHWASMYAKFCKRMLETMSPDVRDERIKDKAGNIVSGGNLFRKYLLNRCQEEFERGWAVNLPEPPKEEEEDSKAEKTEKTGEAALLSDEYYIAAAAKRRGLGLVQFIGELYKLGMLTERIMHECVHKLVDYKGIPDEAEIESLSKLLRTIGANLDATEKGRPMMDAYFQRIQTMADMPDLPSRLKFMLMDVVDLRRANWHSKEANKGPKTLDEVRAEAEAAQAAKAQENARSNQRGGGGGRPPIGRGDARNFSAGYSQTSNQVGMDDLRRLKGSASRAMSGNMTLGPASMFSSRSNSGRRLGPGGSLGRAGEESGASSRTGTPPTSQTTSHLNAFSLLANMGTDDHPASPPSTSASPALSKAVPADSDKKESS